MGLYDVADDDTLRTFWTYGEHILKRYHDRMFPILQIKPPLDVKLPKPEPTTQRTEQPQVSVVTPQSPPSKPSKAEGGYHTPPVTRVAVIGGGISGLVAARKLGVKHKVDVYEAAERVGGRLYTHKFENGGEWDYFDVGAMRFPKTAVMRPTYELFQELRDYITLLPYEMKNNNTFLYYNNTRVTRQVADTQQQTFGASDHDSPPGNVPQHWATIGYDELMRIVFGRWLDALRANFETGLAQIETYDQHSTRSYMTFVTHPAGESETGDPYPEKIEYPTTVVNWLETMWFSVGWFDRAFVETVLEMYAFDVHFNDPSKPDAPVPGTDWRCVKHGSQRIAEGMAAFIQADPTLGQNVTIHLQKQVTSVAYDRSSGEIMISGVNRPKLQSDPSTPFKATEKYSHVVLAVSPQVMRYIDLSSCELDYAQRSSLLMLHCGPSTKVGLKFKTNWWGTFGITGGQSQTDRPVRTVVYPSYGNGESTVLIASYCWTQDASTMGALMQGRESFDEQRLKACILQDLADIHQLPLEFMIEQCEDMHAFDWTHNPTTLGAYAFFGPGQFTSLYENLTRPAADGRVHFAGEAVSTCHAWVAGAIESASRVVAQIDPQTHLPAPTGTAGGMPFGQAVQISPVFLSRELILRQLIISRVIQEAEFPEPSST